MTIKKILAVATMVLAVSAISLPSYAGGSCPSKKGGHYSMKSCPCCSSMKMVCQTRPAHWWNTTWVGETQECGYMHWVR
jgi:hypothetical protein